VAKKLAALVVAAFAAVTLAAAPDTSAAPGATTRVSLPNLVDQSILGLEAVSYSERPSVNADGRFVAFDSYAPNLVVNDNNGTSDIFVHNRQTGATELVSRHSDGTQANGFSIDPAISADGRFVAFESDATNLVPNDTNNLRDVFVRDLTLNLTTRINVQSAGGQANGGWSGLAAISGDGRFIAFQSSASNLVVGDTNGALDIFVHDRQSGLTERESVNNSGSQVSNSSFNPSLNGDGRFVAFQSSASLTDDDTNGFTDVFLRDRQSGTNERISVSTAGIQGNEYSSKPVISQDARYVAFESYASNLVAGDTNNTTDVFVKDRQTEETQRISVSSSRSEGDESSSDAAVSSDGRFVAFRSYASNLVPGDTNVCSYGHQQNCHDVFLHDKSSGITVRVNLDNAGNQVSDGSLGFLPPAISSDGRFVAFDSQASTLVEGDTNNQSDVFVRDIGDSDNDGAWDPFDTCPTNADCDGDSAPDGVDNCPNWPNPTQTLPPWLIPAGDPDCDGFGSNTENAVGTAPLAHCGGNAWPADVNNDGYSDISDVIPLVNHFGQAVSPALVRYNIAPDPPDGFVDITDIVRMLNYFGKGCA